MCPPWLDVEATWRYDWTCAPFSLLESRNQTANRSVQPFFHISRKIVVSEIGATWRIRLNLCILPYFGKSIGSPFSAQLTAESAYTLWRPEVGKRWRFFFVFWEKRPLTGEFSAALIDYNIRSTRTWRNVTWNSNGVLIDTSERFVVGWYVRDVLSTAVVPYVLCTAVVQYVLCVCSVYSCSTVRGRACTEMNRSTLPLQRQRNIHRNSVAARNVNLQWCRPRDNYTDVSYTRQFWICLHLPWSLIIAKTRVLICRS